MVKQAVARTMDLQPIDRLEEKITALVSMVSQLRAEQARSAAENARLSQEIDTLRSQLADADGTATELSSLREERETIRTRVTEMLQQIESLSI